MSDNTDPIQITSNDIQEANQLSLSCPICAGPVEKHSTTADLNPVICDDCGTLYHHVCWQNNGGKCAVLGCSSQTYRPHGEQAQVITISMNDIPSEAQVAQRNKRLKRIEQERRRQQESQRQRTTTGRVNSRSLQPAPEIESPESKGFWGDLFSNILKAFGFRQ